MGPQSGRHPALNQACPGFWYCAASNYWLVMNRGPALGDRSRGGPREHLRSLNPIYGSAQWQKLSQAERDELAHHLSSWLFSQFLHGEQGALTVAARIVESVPDMDSTFYAAAEVDGAVTEGAAG